MSKLAKPVNIENDAFRSAKWDELTAGRDFSQSDAPTLALLVSWYQVIEQCMDASCAHLPGLQTPVHAAFIPNGGQGSDSRRGRFDSIFSGAF